MKGKYVTSLNIYEATTSDNCFWCDGVLKLLPQEYDPTTKTFTKYFDEWLFCSRCGKRVYNKSTRPSEIA